MLNYQGSININDSVIVYIKKNLKYAYEIISVRLFKLIQNNKQCEYGHKFNRN